ncbi:glycosyltransferase family 4 protein [Halobacterium wangiae]|uniref:glycosyltransferase family 4 protein n=1 Tax=Halobacterium wangiae TaxID=2902623 RepID=UPI001E28383B|nr:glycosyltransferase family 4 protein [Halobacterium wangiae]
MKVWHVVSEENQVVTGLKDVDGVDAFMLSPVQSLVMSFFAIRGKYDIIHFHYLQVQMDSSVHPLVSVLKFFSFLLNLVVMKAAGIKIVWTGHHVESHEASIPAIDKLGRRLVVSLADHIFVLEPPVQNQIEREYSMGGDLSVARLGDPRIFHHEKDAGDSSKINFPEVGPVITMIGNLRPYKRVPLGIRAVAELNGTESMLIAGNPLSEELEGEIQSSIDRYPVDVTTEFGFVADEDILEYVERSDVVLILNDQETVPATALLSAAFQTPVVTVPGGVKEFLVDEYNLGVVAETDSAEAIADAIQDILSNPPEIDHTSFLSDHSWGAYTEHHLEVYETLTS